MTEFLKKEISEVYSLYEAIEKREAEQLHAKGEFEQRVKALIVSLKLDPERFNAIQLLQAIKD